MEMSSPQHRKASRNLCCLTPAQTAAVFAACFYGFISTSITFFNKAVLTLFNFQESNLLLLFQCLLTVSMLLILRYFRLISFTVSVSITYCLKLFPISLLYCLNVVFALYSLKTLNVAMYGTLKRLTVAIVMGAEVVVLKKRFSRLLVCSVGLMVLGAVIAGRGDVSFSFNGWIFSVLSCCFQAAYLLIIAKTGEDVDSLGILFYHSILSIPILAIIAAWNGEFSTVLSHYSAFDSNFKMVFALNMIFGSMLNYSMFLCTTTSSALTTTVIGQLKNVVTLILSFFLLGGVTVTVWNMTGLWLTALAGVWYSYLKYTGGAMRSATPRATGLAEDPDEAKEGHSLAVAEVRSR